MRRPTQHDRILELLRKWPDGVCGSTFLALYMPTYSQRIGELRRKGYTIVPVPCPYRKEGWTGPVTNHGPVHTHTSQIATYKFLGEPPPGWKPDHHAGQLELA